MCGTSSSVEVGGRRAEMWMLSSFVVPTSIVPRLAYNDNDCFTYILKHNTWIYMQVTGPSTRNSLTAPQHSWHHLPSLFCQELKCSQERIISMLKTACNSNSRRMLTLLIHHQHHHHHSTLGIYPQTAGHALLLGPTAPFVTELLQLPVPGYEQFTAMSQRCWFTVQSVPVVTKDIFVWIVGPRRSVNYFNHTV